MSCRGHGIHRNEKGTAPIRGESNNHHHANNGAAKPAESVSAPPIAVEEIDEGKTEQEVDLVEDAHEKAMAEDTSSDEVDGNVEVSSNGETEETPEPEEIQSKTE